MFISSAASLVEELHVDGLRVDLTQAIHRDNALHADGAVVGSANLFGQKLLREWSRTLQHDPARRHADRRGPHRLGRGHQAAGRRRPRLRRHLVRRLLPQPDRRLGHGRRPRAAAQARPDSATTSRSRMDAFAGALCASAVHKVVYHESHDEAGNAGGTRADHASSPSTARRSSGPTRDVAEARCRVVRRPVAALGRHADVLHGRGGRAPRSRTSSTTSLRARRTCTASGPATGARCSASTRT